MKMSKKGKGGYSGSKGVNPGVMPAYVPSKKPSYSKPLKKDTKYM